MKKSDRYLQILENTMGVPFTPGNHVDILLNGVEIFPAMLEAIRNAKKYVDLLTFVYWSGPAAENFATALAQKADEGLAIRVLLDSYSREFMPVELVDLMVDNGVALYWFRPFLRWQLRNIDNRCHRKILICDGEVGFTGGVGIAEEWEGDARNPSEYRDTHFRIRGEAVKGLQAAFEENWIERENYLSLKPAWHQNAGDVLDKTGDTFIQCIRTSESIRWSNLMLLYQTLILAAQESIIITTAYFNPGEIIVQSLTEAADRGVEINIIMPGKYNDERLAKLAGDETFETLLDGGVKLWYYQKTMYHTKKIMVDGIVSCIGSANFNHRSMLKDDEIILVCLDERLTHQLTENFQADLRESVSVDKKQWEKRSIFEWGVEKFVMIGRNEI
jgi:cardiolipin synthase